MNIIYNQDNGIIAVVTLADNTNIETKAKVIFRIEVQRKRPFTRMDCK